MMTTHIDDNHDDNDDNDDSHDDIWWLSLFTASSVNDQYTDLTNNDTHTRTHTETHTDTHRERGVTEWLFNYLLPRVSRWYPVSPSRLVIGPDRAGTVNSRLIQGQSSRSTNTWRAPVVVKWLNLGLRYLISDFVRRMFKERRLILWPACTSVWGLVICSRISAGKRRKAVSNWYRPHTYTVIIS